MKTAAALGGTGLALVAFLIAIYAVIIAISAAVLSWAWNLVVPETFGGPTLEFVPAAALIIVFLVIRNILFGGGSSKS